MQDVAKIQDVDRIREFALAGNALFTLRSQRTDDHLTFRVRQADDRDGLHFVYAGTGHTMRYLGCIWDGQDYVQSSGSKFERDAKQARAFDWFWSRVADGDDPEQCEFWHEGRCGRCNRTLTDPDSIARGLGPVCLEKIGAA